jgi:hypothetical protein
MTARAGKYKAALRALDPVAGAPERFPWEAAYLAAWLRVYGADGQPPADGIRSDSPSPDVDELFDELLSQSRADRDQRLPADAHELEVAATLLEHAVAECPPTVPWPRILLAEVRREQGDHVEAARLRLLASTDTVASASDLVGCVHQLAEVLDHLTSLDPPRLIDSVDLLADAVGRSSLPETIVPEIRVELYVAAAQRLVQLRRLGQADELLRKAEVLQSDSPLLQQIGVSGGSRESPRTRRPLAGAEVSDSLVRRVFAILDRMTAAGAAQATANPPAALLLFGPSGTGKTHIVRNYADARDQRFRFRKVRMDQLFGKWVGDSEKAVTELLRDVGSAPHGGLVFLDELDALGTQRDASHEVWRSSLVGHFLAEVDHFKETSKGAAIVGGTNRIWALDHAVLRRFDEIVLTPLPSDSERRDLFNLLAAEAGVDLSEDAVTHIVAASHGTTPADCTAAFDNVQSKGGVTSEFVRDLRDALEDRRSGNHLARWIALSREKLEQEGFDHLLKDFDRHYGSVGEESVRLAVRHAPIFEPVGSAHLQFVNNQLR